MNSNKHNIPSLASHNAAYNILLRKAKTRNERDKILTYQPALITFRKNLLEKMQRDNYRLEHERILGELEGHAATFNVPGGHWQRDKLINRSQMLKKLLA